MTDELDFDGNYAVYAMGGDPDSVNNNTSSDNDSNDGSDDDEPETLLDAVSMESDALLLYLDKYREGDWTDINPESPEITLDIAEMRDRDQEFAESFIQNPDLYLGRVRESSRFDDAEFDADDVAIKIVGTESERWSIGESPRGRINTVVMVDAQITTRRGRTTVRLENAWECKRCGTVNWVSTGDDWAADAPVECAGCQKQGPFTVDAEKSNSLDYREFEAEELPDQAEVDGDPESVRAEAVRRAIVDSVDAAAGTRVRLTAILRSEPVKDESQQEVPHYLDVRHCETLDRDDTIGEMSNEEWDIVEEIRSDPDRSLLEEIKDTVHPSAVRENALRAGILSVVGSPDGEQSGSRVRGDIHLMYIGDPGAGKSTMIDVLTEITPKFGKTAGGTSSSVGLTASATQGGIGMTDSGWVLRPGLLPRSHGGTLFVNEFDDIDADSRKSLNEAMESGVVEVSKAGMSATFPAEANVVVSANPKYGSFRTDVEEPLAEQVQFSTPITSRFDLIYPFISRADWGSDMEMADNLLNGHTDDDSGSKLDEDTDLTVDLIQKLIAEVRDSVHPTVERDSTAAQKLKQKYANLREHASGRGLPIDPRTFQSLARLARAHARLRGADMVSEEDADIAIHLMESSLTQLDVLPETVSSDDIMDIREAAARASQTTKPSQQERRDAILNAVDSMVDTSPDGVYRAVSEDLDIDRDTFDDEWDSMLSDGTLVLTGDGDAEVMA